jgi:hypothetical protein
MDIGVLAAAILLGRPHAGIPALLVESITSGAIAVTDEDGRVRIRLVDGDRVADADDRAAIVRLFAGADPDTGIALDRGDERLGNRVADIQSAAAAALRTRRLMRASGRPTAKGDAIVRELQAAGDLGASWAIVRGVETSEPSGLSAETLVALGAFGHMAAAAGAGRAGGPLTAPGSTAAGGLWTGSTHYTAPGIFSGTGGNG